MTAKKNFSLIGSVLLGLLMAHQALAEQDPSLTVIPESTHLRINVGESYALGYQVALEPVVARTVVRVSD